MRIIPSMSITFTMYIVLIPLEIGYFLYYIWICRQQRTTLHPAYFWACVCVGLLGGHLIRVCFVVMGRLAYSPIDFQVWVYEHVPFGCYFYEKIKQKFQRMATS